MPRIPFTIRTIPFVTELGIAVPARRLFLSAQFVGALGSSIPYPTFLDTGSAYSVIPCRLASQVRWKDLGAYSILGGQTYHLEWNTIPCRMGELEVELVDSYATVRTRALRVLAKIASRPGAPHLEQVVMLGMSFLTDNKVRQAIDASGAIMSGSLWVA